MSATHRPRPAVLGWLSLVACLTSLLADSPAAASGPESAAPPPLVVASESASVTVLVDDRGDTRREPSRCKVSCELVGRGVEDLL